MKIKSLELKNYKSHKHFNVELNGDNKLIQGHKGSGKTSIRDAFYWLMTGSMVDDPTPVDDMGVIIDNLTISSSLELMSGEQFMIESKQKRNKKGVIQANHEMTYYIDSTPCLKSEYLVHLEKHFGTLEQRKILLDPSWFAHGDGLKVAGKTPKTATQRRREIVINAAGISDIEASIAENDTKSKQAKFALGKLKKDQDATFAGVESLDTAKIDVNHLDIEAIKESIINLRNEESASVASLETLNSGNDTQNALQRTLSDAQTALSQSRSNYTQNASALQQENRKPYDEYHAKKQHLVSKLQQAKFGQQQEEQARINVLNEVNRLTELRKAKLEEYQSINASKYNPTSTTCPTCSQSLPVEQMISAEARFNKNKSEQLERIKLDGVSLAEQLELKSKEAQQPQRDFGIESIESEIAKLGNEPTIELVPQFESTKEYQELTTAIENAKASLVAQDDEGTKDIYRGVIANIREKIKEQQALLGLFETNAHLDKQIEVKSQELQEISSNIDAQNDILDDCKEFVRNTLSQIETKLEEVFDGIRFKMFEYTLDGSQVDTCITYAKTQNGYIPWESLSGGQKRSATIKLANAFSKAWGIALPLFIDDTQIYQEDELDATMQLIRITEVPNALLEVK